MLWHQPSPDRPRRLRTGPAPVVVALVMTVTALASCASSTATSGDGRLRVVAAENFWGSLAAQLGGAQAQVTSILSDPNADPHEYETSPVDARSVAAANLVILNGAGYDDWGAKLVAAQPEPERRVLTVATLLGKKPGDNPHFWYNPAYVFRVINQITRQYRALRPAQAAYFAARHAAVEADLVTYRSRLAAITARDAGRPVASTESIFQYLADYLHLDLVSSYPFMKAVAEGVDPPASSVAAFDRQIQNRSFDVLVYNVQTVTPLTTTIRQAAVRRGIPVVGVSETIEPPTDSFEQWMDGELATLARALGAGAGAR